MATCDSVFVGEWIRTITSAASPALVVLGWWWVNRQSNRRESRKELRQLVDRSLMAVSGIVELNMSIHAKKLGEEPSQLFGVWKMIIAFRQLATQITLLDARGLDVSSCRIAFIGLKQLLTGGDFMTKQWQAWEVEDQRWAELAYATTRLTHSLDTAFFKMFSG